MRARPQRARFRARCVTPTRVAPPPSLSVLALLESRSRAGSLDVELYLEDDGDARNRDLWRTERVTDLHARSIHVIDDASKALRAASRAERERARADEPGEPRSHVRFVDSGRGDAAPSRGEKGVERGRHRGMVARKPTRKESALDTRVREELMRVSDAARRAAARPSTADRTPSPQARRLSLVRALDEMLVVAQTDDRRNGRRRPGTSARVVDTPVEPSRLADALRRLAPDEPLLRKLDEPTTAALLERVQEAADLDEDVTIGLLAKWVTGEAAADARAACVQDAAREEITRLAARGAPRETRRAQKPNETWASQLASREREKANMLQVFDEIDVDGSGFVYKHELDAGLRQLRSQRQGALGRGASGSADAFASKALSQGDVETLFEKLDVDGDKRVDRGEFLRWLGGAQTGESGALIKQARRALAQMLSSGKSARRRLEKAFAELDVDGSGAIDMAEMDKLLSRIGLELPLDTINALVKALDRDGDGECSMDELVRFVHGGDARAEARCVVRFRNALADVVGGPLARERLADLHATMRAEGLEKLIQQSARTATHDKTASSSARKKGARQPRDGGGDDDDDEDAPMTGNDLTEAIEACAAMLAELEVRRPRPLSPRPARAVTHPSSLARRSSGSVLRSARSSVAGSRARRWRTSMAARARARHSARSSGTFRP